jgi:hypothetical protein
MSPPSNFGAGLHVQIYSEATKLLGKTLSLAHHLLRLREDIRDPTTHMLCKPAFISFT